MSKNREGGGLHSFSLDFDKPKRFTAIKKTAKCLDEHEFPRGIKKKENGIYPYCQLISRRIYTVLMI